MQIWEMESYPCGDMRLPHHVFPPKFIPQTQLNELSGVHLYKVVKLISTMNNISIHFQVDLDDTMATKKRLTRVREQFNVCGADVVILDKKLGDLDTKVWE
jgi:1,2-dihydroxy-3-keto-5-methylthiopentene dioxygenase